MIFTDLRMPIMSGQEMIKKIREYEISKNLSSTPIIIISGEPSEIEIDRCINQLKVNYLPSRYIYIYRPMRS